METLRVEMRGISKRFPGVQANNLIDFAVEPGKIHALLGENGAGKTTLMEILYGTFQPDTGRIFLNGQPVVLHSPKEALRLGIGMVHQQFRLIPRLTVAENIVLGLSTFGILLNLSKARQRITELSNKYHLQVNPDAHVWQLSVGEQQRVEILKMLYRQVRILILDEPTAVLAPSEVDSFFSVLSQLAKEGCGIVLITHKLQEVMDVADQITVLREGRVVGTIPREQASSNVLAQMMIGKELNGLVKTELTHPGEDVLVISDLIVRGHRGNKAVNGVSFTVRRGEILGLAGVAGNGQTELVMAITAGLGVVSGKITIRRVDATYLSPARIASLGVGHIPEDRRKAGLALGLSTSDSLIARQHSGLGQGPFLNPRLVNQFALALLERYDVHPANPSLSVNMLSGGNQQRIVLARELASNPRLLVAVHPTRGLDIRATKAIHALLIQLRQQNGAILLISEDLTEIMEICDRVAVMCRGQIIGIDTRDNLANDNLRLAQWMAGICEGGAP